MFEDLLLPMFDDEYYPDILSLNSSSLLSNLLKSSKPALAEQDIYRYAHQTVNEINEMKPQFEDLDSSLDDSVADYIAEAMMMVVQDAGYLDLEMEELVMNREW